jgi:hypothetical protein
MVKPRTRRSVLLAAFFEEHEVRTLLAAKGAHSAEEVEKLITDWRVSRQTLIDAAPWADTGKVEVNPVAPDLAAVLEPLKGSDVFKTTVENLPHELAVVSLPDLIAFQFTVDSPYAESINLSPAPALAEIASLTLPMSGPDFPIQISGDHTGLTVSAPGPNLRISSMGLERQGSGMPRMVVDLTFGSPLMQVVEFNGRFILRNGYHRAVGLLRRGLTHAPVVLIHGSQYQHTGATGPGFFAPHVVMGPKPALLKHYDSEFALAFEAVDLRKAIRLRPDEFQMGFPE